jgi:hypothetical protein
MRIRWIGLVVMGVTLAGAGGVGAQTCDDFDQCTTNDMCSNGECSGTPTASGACDDFDDCTINDHCDPELGCTGDPAPLDTPCGGGCGKCKSLSPFPIPGLPLQCVGDVADNGSECDTSSLGPCLSGSCQIFETAPGFPAIAFCLPHPRECPDAGGCKGACNPATDRCDNSLSRCFGTCERCENNTCVPANQGNACDDFNDCTGQSRCDILDIGGVPRGFCMAGVPSGDTPTPTATGGVATPTRTAGPPGACVGDCNGDGTITVNELITGVNIALGNTSVSACPSFDTSGDGTVAVNELISAVNAALNGCA